MLDAVLSIVIALFIVVIAFIAKLLNGVVDSTQTIKGGYDLDEFKLMQNVLDFKNVYLHDVKQCEDYFGVLNNPKRFKLIVIETLVGDYDQDIIINNSDKFYQIDDTKYLISDEDMRFVLKHVAITDVQVYYDNYKIYINDKLTNTHSEESFSDWDIDEKFINLYAAARKWTYDKLTLELSFGTENQPYSGY